MNLNDITLDDLSVLVDEFIKIKELEENYKTDYLNRKERAIEIDSSIEKFRQLSEILEDFLIDGAPTYYQDHITDIKLAFELILRLANQKEDKYIMKEFYTPNYMGERNNDNIVDGVIYVIGDKNLLHTIDNKKKYLGISFGRSATKMIDGGNSLVVFSKHSHDFNIKPRIINDKCSFVNFRVSGYFNDLLCYLYDDELGRAVIRFKEFIDENGADIKNIPIDFLYDYIGNQTSKVYSLKK